MSWLLSVVLRGRVQLKGECVRLRNKAIGRVLMSGVAALVVVLAGQTPALASSDAYLEYYAGDGSLRGRGYFQADPNAGAPGDAIKACDVSADGYGIEVQMDINPDASPYWQTDRVATTRGQNSPYCTPWVTGNIAEETKVELKICLVKGADFEICTSPVVRRT
ncbi:hypothetical protein [Micromonospora sediminicola]|uniref:hypothetical protein n=1 Tax=Micromonospora sediminicola TaxID=946078 RepID=UPI0037930C31